MSKFLRFFFTIFGHENSESLKTVELRSAKELSRYPEECIDYYPP
jgi:hypothetical protein